MRGPPDDGRAQDYLGMVHGVLAASTQQSCEACRWTAQDAENRAWIGALGPGLAAHEAAIAPRLATRSCRFPLGGDGRWTNRGFHELKLE